MTKKSMKTHTAKFVIYPSENVGWVTNWNFTYDKRLKIDMTQFSKFTHLHHKINLSSVKQPNLSFPSSSAICKWRWKLSKIGCSIYGLRLKYWMHKTLIYFTSEPNFGYKVVQPCTLVSTASVTCAVYMYTCRRSSFEF